MKKWGWGGEVGEGNEGERGLLLEIWKMKGEDGNNLVLGHKEWKWLMGKWFVNGRILVTPPHFVAATGIILRGGSAKFLATHLGFSMYNSIDSVLTV